MRVSAALLFAAKTTCRYPPRVPVPGSLPGGMGCGGMNIALDNETNDPAAWAGCKPAACSLFAHLNAAFPKEDERLQWSFAANVPFLERSQAGFRSG